MIELEVEKALDYWYRHSSEDYKTNLLMIDRILKIHDILVKNMAKECNYTLKEAYEQMILLAKELNES